VKLSRESRLDCREISGVSNGLEHEPIPAAGVFSQRADVRRCESQEMQHYEWAGG
jgi:hypothetical protein